MNVEQRQIGMLTRAAMINPSSVDMEKREFTISFASEYPVLMQWYETFYEVLTMQGMRTERLDSGAPFLDNHNRYGSVSDNVLGVVIEHWREGDKAYAKIKLSKRAELDSLLQDIQDGIVRNISCGYRVHKYEETPRAVGVTIPTYRAVDWEPMEISAVPVGADPTVSVRSEGEKFNVQIQRQMTGKEGQDPTQTPATSPAAPAVGVDEARKAAAIQEERNRVIGITQAVRALKLAQDFADTLIAEGVSVDVARQRAIDEWGKGDPKVAAQQRVMVGEDETDKYRSLMTTAMTLRSGLVASTSLKAEEVKEANKHRSLSLMDLAKRSLDKLGVSYDGMSKMEIVGRAISSNSSDLPVILEGTNRRVLLANFQAVPDTWRQFCAVGSNGDFRDYSRLRMGSFSSLDKVNENAEYKNKTIPDAEKESIRVATKGNTINLSRQMIINDDLAAFTRLAAMLGRAAARSIEQDVYALLALNSGLGPVMSDGKTLFHADHGNIATPGAPTVVAFDGMRQLMAKQQDPSKNDFLGILPSVGLFPLTLGSTARVLIGAQYDPDAINKLQKPNVVVGMLNNVVDTPRMTGTRYYFFANPAEFAALEVAFLDGVQEPYLENETTFDVDGMRWKVRLDYGVAAMEWRAAVTNAG
jgi:hypothetical protein